MGQVDRGEYSDKIISFNDLVDAWLSARAGRVKASTLQFYRDISKHLKNHPPFANKKNVRLIGTEAVEKYIDVKLGEISPRSVGYHLATLKQIFSKAVRWKYIHTNPCDGIKQPRYDKPKPVILTGDQFDCLLENASGQSRLLILAATMSGMRAGELAGLQWRNVNLINGTIFVEEIFSRGELSSPKTKASIRLITIPPQLVDELCRAKDSVKSDSEFVFTSRDGTPLNWSNFLRRTFRPLCNKAGIPSTFKFHALRHFFVSTLLSAGEDLTFIQAQVGHANLSETLNTYSHLMPSKKLGAAARMGKAFASISNSLAEDKKREYQSA